MKTTKQYAVAYDIYTLQEIADYYNASEDIEELHDMIAQSGYTDETGNEYGICRDNDNRVKIDAQGVAYVEPVTLRERFGAQIAAIRTKQGMTQTELSKRTGIDQGHISKIEAGQFDIRLDTIEILERAFNCELKLIEKEA